MSAPDFDPSSLSIDERLDLIDKIWLSIAADAKRGDENAAAVLDLDRPLPPDVLAELRRRAEALIRNPERGIPWERLNAELAKKYG